MLNVPIDAGPQYQLRYQTKSLGRSALTLHQRPTLLMLSGSRHQLILLIAALRFLVVAQHGVKQLAPVGSTAS